jgi:hypothetical protein
MLFYQALVYMAFGAVLMLAALNSVAKCTTWGKRTMKTCLRCNKICTCRDKDNDDDAGYPPEAGTT